MQQKSTQKILLFSVSAQKVEKIKALCKTLGISVQQVEKSDYGQKLGAIAGITGFKKDGSRYSGADFPAELLVFSGINSSQMDIFLAEYKKAGIEPIGCKAVVTPQYLKMSIRDDGIGFQENIDRVTQAFYHENPQDDLKHFGMGMYISRIYCERHGGKLLIKNVADGGAEVEAVFKNYVLEEQQQK